MDSFDITIAEATPNDTQNVVQLFGALHQHNTSLDPRFALADGWERLVEQYLRESLHSDESVWLLACHEQRTIGFVLVEVHTDSPLFRHRRWAEIVGLYVDPAYRGTAVAHTLMEHAYAWAFEHQLHRMQLYVTATNDPARRFYQKQGFVDSQIIMRRTLTDEDTLDELPTTYAQHRLHFSEGGARPLDMHGRQHAE